MSALLTCQVSAGQFPSEASVRFKDSNKEVISLFVPMSEIGKTRKIGKNWIDGQLKVDILEEKDGLVLIYLPGPTFNNGQSVTVRTAQIIRQVCQTEVTA